jgi:hypothetical protein
MLALFYTYAGSVILWLVLSCLGARLVSPGQEIALLVPFAAYALFWLVGGTLERLRFHAVLTVIMTLLSVAHTVFALIGVMAVPIDLALIRGASETRFSAVKLKLPSGRPAMIVTQGWARKPCPACAEWLTVADEDVEETFEIALPDSGLAVVGASYRMRLVGSEISLSAIMLNEEAPQKKLRWYASEVVGRCLIGLRSRLRFVAEGAAIGCPAPESYPVAVGMVRLETIRLRQ